MQVRLVACASYWRPLTGTAPVSRENVAQNTHRQSVYRCITWTCHRRLSFSVQIERLHQIAFLWHVGVNFEASYLLMCSGNIWMNLRRRQQQFLVSIRNWLILHPHSHHTHFHTYLVFSMVYAALLYAVNFKQVTVVIIKRGYLPAFVKVHFYQVVSVTISIVRFY